MAKGSKRKKPAGKENLPGFIVQHKKDETFVLGMEVNGVFQCWKSFYPPSMDVRYKREIVKTGNQPLKTAANKQEGLIWDKGLYRTGKGKTSKEVEASFSEGISENKVSFVLYGEKLNGRFIIRFDRSKGALYIYKQKDKFARDEDPLGMELQRSVSKWVPEYDPDTFVVEPPKNRKRKFIRAAPQTEEPAIAEEPAPEKEWTKEEFLPDEKPVKPASRVRQPAVRKKQPPAPPLPQTRKLKNGFSINQKNNVLQFQFYEAVNDAAGMICLVNQDEKPLFVMKANGKGQWKISSPVSAAVKKQEAVFGMLIERYFNL